MELKNRPISAVFLDWTKVSKQQKHKVAEKQTIFCFFFTPFLAQFIQIKKTMKNLKKRKLAKVSCLF